MRTPHRLSAPTAYLVLEGVGGVLATLFGTLFSVYVIVEAHLGPFELVLLGTVLEGSILLFEIPTGVVADTVSRRLSVIIGMAVTGAALLLMGSVPRFGWLVVASVLWGLGDTFVSGAYEAWITDEVGEEHVAQVFTRETQVDLSATVLGSSNAISHLDAVALHPMGTRVEQQSSDRGAADVEASDKGIGGAHGEFPL